PEREFGAEVCVPIFAEHADVAGEQPADARAQLHADRCVAVGLVPRSEVEAVVRVRHEDRRADSEIRLGLGIRQGCARQQRSLTQTERSRSLNTPLTQTFRQNTFDCRPMFGAKCEKSTPRPKLSGPTSNGSQ